MDLNQSGSWYYAGPPPNNPYKPYAPDEKQMREFLARAYGKCPPPNTPSAPAAPPDNFLITADLRFGPGEIVIVRRNADEPLVTRAVAAYLEDWFSKEPAQ
jgi:hypothetical protein